MKYDLIDPIFYAWAKRHDLLVYTECKDEEVRMVQMFGQGKERVGIGVDVRSDGRYEIGVGITRRPSRNSQFEKLEAELDTLDRTLEQAYSKAHAWLCGSP
jgi:hypothetical protein